MGGCVPPAAGRRERRCRVASRCLRRLRRLTSFSSSIMTGTHETLWEPWLQPISLVAGGSNGDGFCFTNQSLWKNSFIHFQIIGMQITEFRASVDGCHLLRFRRVFRAFHSITGELQMFIPVPG